MEPMNYYVLIILIFICCVKCQAEDTFSLCHELNQYGCNPTEIPSIVESYINSIENYVLPQNPCEFDTINMTWIFTQVDASVLDLVSDNSYFATIPCQLLIQIPNILTDRNIQYLTEHNYWFGNNDNSGQCDTQNTDNNLYNITVCNYTEDGNVLIANVTEDKCTNDDRCYYPFVRSNFPTNKLKDFGMCHCQESCEFRFFGGDIDKLDIFNQCCIWLSLIFIIVYFVNLFFELHSAKKNKQQINNLPLTFDIPFICACALLLFDICMLLPYLIGKDYFSCETGTKAWIRSRKLPYANWACFIQGSIIYVSVITIYTYFMILSFCVWRYLHKPLNPLYGIHKKYWHLAIWIYILGLYIGLVCDTSNSSMGANNILGICGSHLWTKPESYIFNWYPILFTLIVFVIITPMTVFKLWKHFNYGNGNNHMNNNNANKLYGKELINLSVRLVMYTCLLCASCICFMYIIGELLFNNDTWQRIAKDYVFCLVFETYFIDIGLVGDLNKCTLDPNNELPISVYYMQGTVILLASLASFVLSCSNSKYIHWKKMNTKLVSKLRSMSSMDNNLPPNANTSISRIQSSTEKSPNMSTYVTPNTGNIHIKRVTSVSASPPPLELEMTNVENIISDI